MGLLDDAIRQHLELKRRHGADPSDVAKLEQEAFGPIERDDALAVDAGATVSEATHETAREEELAYEEAELEAEESWQAERPAPPPPSSRRRRLRAAAPCARADPGGAHGADAMAPETPPAPEGLRPGGSVRLDDVGERTRQVPPPPPTSPIRAPTPSPASTTSSRRPPSSCRRRRSTIASGSSRSRRATSTSDRLVKRPDGVGALKSPGPAPTRTPTDAGRWGTAGSRLR
jgi:hypothetical protein